MKKFMMFFVLLLTVCLGSLAIAFGQVTEPPTDWMEIVTNPGVWFASFTAVSLLNTFVTSVLVGWWKVEKKFLQQLIAWGTGIILVAISAIFKFGYAAEFTVLVILAHGFFIGLSSNGWADTPALKSVLRPIENWINKITTRKKKE